MNKTDDGALRAELERLQLDSEAAEERHAMEMRQMRIEHEELQVALHAANQRWRRAEQALADQSLALARIERERSKERIVQRGSQTWGKDAAPQSVSSVMGLDQLAHIGDDLRAAAGRRRAAKAAAARSLKQNAGAAKYRESTDRRLRSSAGTKLSPTTAPRQSKDGSKTLKRSLSSISSSMAIKQAETAAAVAALQIRSKAHADKGAARSYNEELSPRLAWRGGCTSRNQTVEASRKDRIREALQ